MKKYIYFILLVFGIEYCQAQIALPYYTGFDSPAENLGWQEYRTGFQSLSHWTNTSMLAHDYNVGGSMNDTVIDWYVSPPLNFSWYGQMSFKIRVGGFSPATVDNLEIWIGTNNQNPALGSFSKLANLSLMQPNNIWLDTVIDINQISDSTYIAFKYKTIGSAWWTPNIDSLRFWSLSTKINSITNTAPVSIYPNPSKSLINIKTSDATQIFLLNIYDNLGRLCWSKNIQGTAQLATNLSSGLYFCTLQNKSTGQVFTQKLIIEK